MRDCHKNGQKWLALPKEKPRNRLVRSLSMVPNLFLTIIITSRNKRSEKAPLQNGYSQGVITYNINEVLNKNRSKPNNPVQATVPQKDILILLPHLGLHWKIWPIYRRREMSVDSEFTDLVLILLKKQNVCKLILQTFCLAFSSFHFKMFVKCL